MSESDSKPKATRSKALHEKVQPLSIVGVSVFIVGFLAVVIANQQFPDAPFVQKFLRGYRGVLAVFLLWFVVMAFTAFVENRSLRRQQRR
jgi:uncharacterized membrane protein